MTNDSETPAPSNGAAEIAKEEMDKADTTMRRELQRMKKEPKVADAINAEFAKQKSLLMDDLRQRAAIDGVSIPDDASMVKIMKETAQRFEQTVRPELAALKAYKTSMDHGYQPIDSLLRSLPPNPNHASEFLRRLVEMANQFNKSLDNEHEVGARLVSFGQTQTFHLENISYYDPSLITFSGHTETGDPVTLVQHVSQISVLFIKMKRSNPEKPKMGFVIEPPPATVEPVGK